MNPFFLQLVRTACAAMCVLEPVFDQEVSGAAVSDALLVANSNSKNIAASVDNKTGSATLDTIDAGYFKLQSEPCLPLRPAEQTVRRIAGSNQQLSTVDAAVLSFSWRQIQHYRAESMDPRKVAQCYYFGQ